MAFDRMNFDGLVAAIERTHSALAEQAGKAVNVSLTLRNWFIGYYIQEYEQSGTDRAAYGEQMLESLAERLQSGGLKRVEARELRRFRQFYLAYPQIRETASPEFAGAPTALPNIWQTLSAKLESPAGDIREAESPELDAHPFSALGGIRSARKDCARGACTIGLLSSLSLDSADTVRKIDSRQNQHRNFGVAFPLFAQGVGGVGGR